MSDVIAKAADAITERLVELEEEKKRLERALASLTGESRRPGRPRGSAAGAPKPSRRRRSRKRAKRGEREAQLTASIRSHPNYKPADHAREIGVSPNQVYGLIAKMTKAGAIAKGADGKLAITGAGS